MVVIKEATTLELGEPLDIEIYVKRCYETGKSRPMKDCVECEWHIWSAWSGSQCAFPGGKK